VQVVFAGTAFLLWSKIAEMPKAEHTPELDQMIAAQMKVSPVADWGITHGMYAMGAPTPRAYLAATPNSCLQR
jgi:hypothetical protein